MFSLLTCKQLKEIDEEQSRLKREWQGNVRVQTQKMHGFAESIFFRDLWFDLSNAHAEAKKLIALNNLDTARQNRELTFSEKRAVAQLLMSLERDPSKVKLVARNYIKPMTAQELAAYDKFLHDDTRLKQFLVEHYTKVLDGMLQRATEKKRTFLKHYKLLQDAKKAMADPRDVTWVDTINVIIEDPQFKEFVSADMNPVEDGDPHNMRTTLLPDGLLQTLMTNYTRLLNATDKYIDWANGAKEQIQSVYFEVNLPKEQPAEQAAQQKVSDEEPE